MKILIQCLVVLVFYPITVEAANVITFGQMETDKIN
jgi:hypothetical protein